MNSFFDYLSLSIHNCCKMKLYKLGWIYELMGTKPTNLSLNFD